MKNLRTKFTAFLVGFAFVISGAALAETFNLFSPATGILKGNSRSYVTTAAASADVVALWTGACSASTFLAGDGTCQPEAGGGTVTSVGLSMPSGFSVANSPVTSSGTLTVTTALSGLINGTGTGFANATATNVTAEFSGTCNATTFLRGDGSCATPASGGTPGGSNTQFQYNNAGAFAGAAQLAWDAAQNDLLLGPATGVGAGGTLRPANNVTGTGAGSDISVWGGTSTTGTASGGAVDIRGGGASASSGNSFGGDVRIFGGEGSFSSNVGGGSVEISGGEGNLASGGGGVTISGGAAQGTGLPGDISITAGTPNEQRGGNVDISAGDANTQGTNNFNGGNVVINAGSAVGTGIGGTVTLSTAGTNRLIINNLGSWVLNTNTGTTGQVLTSQGASASPIWANPAASGGSTLPVRTFTTTDVSVAADCGKAIIFNGGASQTFTLNATPPVNCVLTFINNSTSPVTLSGSGSLTWLNGSGTNPTGNRVIAGGGVLTATPFTTAGQWYIWGSGAT